MDSPKDVVMEAGLCDSGGGGGGEKTRDSVGRESAAVLEEPVGAGAGVVVFLQSGQRKFRCRWRRRSSS